MKKQRQSSVVWWVSICVCGTLPALASLALFVRMLIGPLA